MKIKLSFSYQLGNYKHLHFRRVDGSDTVKKFYNLERKHSLLFGKK